MRAITLGVFALGLAVSSSSAYVVSRGRPFTGDEPHYLLAVHSIAYDQDLDLRNNYTNRDYARFWRGELRPHLHAFDYLGDGRLHPMQAPGLAFLLAVPYRLGGAAGAMAAMVLTTAALATLSFRLALLFTKGVKPALVGTAILFLTSPLSAYSGQIYPEIPGALLISGAFALSAGGKRSGRRALLVAVSVAALPWLHSRFILVAAALFLFGLFRWRSSRRSMAVLGAGVAVSALALAAFNLQMYGGFLPTAARKLEPFTAIPAVSLGTLPAGLAGLFLDQEFGLLVYAPIYALVVPATLVAGLEGLRRRELGPALLPVVFLAGFLPGATYAIWWGATSIPPVFWYRSCPCCRLRQRSPSREFTAGKDLDARCSDWSAFSVCLVSVWPCGWRAHLLCTRTQATVPQTCWRGLALPANRSSACCRAMTSGIPTSARAAFAVPRTEREPLSQKTSQPSAGGRRRGLPTQQHPYSSAEAPLYR